MDPMPGGWCLMSHPSLSIAQLISFPKGFFKAKEGKKGGDEMMLTGFCGWQKCLAVKTGIQILSGDWTY